MASYLSYISHLRHDRLFHNVESIAIATAGLTQIAGLGA